MSMSKKFLFTGAVIFLSFTPFVHAVQFDVRGGYNIENHSYESRFKVSNSWSSGWWASMETDSNNGSPSLDDMTSSYNEMETNYTWHINDRFALVPGGVIHWSNSGTQLRPYIRLNGYLFFRQAAFIKFMWSMIYTINIIVQPYISVAQCCCHFFVIFRVSRYNFANLAVMVKR
ncbi:oligogalacturonate-specific porin KdgM family protein [Citrobacter sp. CK202]|uniref:oligogalacturonate-specific porin KdgM family protein n=1 Tax=Citrobacter sp. CK202 TaxID=2985111 RepID=UPI002578C24E|nr:oligogalacturonate-specific porin KdgM family protein [Citrobacter sp. CK202]MDM2961384.1 oligogalacturonate-specific porin KdgM family protein [Citrobacter sp. CK202]